jgi:hypothetical protein
LFCGTELRCHHQTEPKDTAANQRLATVDLRPNDLVSHRMISI